MIKELPPDEEILRKSLERKFEALSCEVEILKPLDLSKEEIIFIRSALIEVGYNVENLPEKEKSSLRELMFREHQIDRHRGSGVVGVLGKDRAIQLTDWCRQKGEEHNWYIIGTNERSRGRGLQQTAADIVSIAVFPEDEEYIEKLIARINKRVYKGYRKRNKEHQEVLDKIFKEVEKPSKFMASIPPGTLIEVWEYMISELAAK